MVPRRRSGDPPRVQDDFRPASKAHPGIDDLDDLDDLDAVAARLTRAGHDVTPDRDFPGFRRFYAHDPLGNRLEFLAPEES